MKFFVEQSGTLYDEEPHHIKQYAYLLNDKDATFAVERFIEYDGDGVGEDFRRFLKEQDELNRQVFKS